MGKCRGGKSRRSKRMTGCKEKHEIKRDWEKLLEVSEKAVAGSAKKLRRIERRREGHFEFKKGHPCWLLGVSFFWDETLEGWLYWESLAQKINTQ